MAGENLRVGFIGLGVMGSSMAANLLHEGYEMVVYTRTKSKARELLASGAKWAESTADLSQHCNVIFTMVGSPDEVETLYLGTGGIVESAIRGTYLIDMTTSSPVLARKIYHSALDKNLHSLDAPVSGGDVGAKNGTLSIMVGGSFEIYQKLEPLLKVMGSNIVYQGDSGAGQYTKISNQIAVASNMIGVCEAVAYAEKAGLDAKQVLKSIANGAAGSWSLTYLAPKMIDRNYEPGFYIKHFVKDMKIAIETADGLGLKMPGLSLAKSLYDILTSSGEKYRGTQALYKLYIEGALQNM